MINVKNLNVGDSVRLPIYPENNPVEGKVIYIQPGRFFQVEFAMENGNVIRESFPLAGPLTPRNS